jgi:hypothetical protein
METCWSQRSSLGRDRSSAHANSNRIQTWFFHVLLPVAGYAILVLSAFVAISQTREGLFGAGAGALMLLFVGIHNAWDSVAYLVFVKKAGKDNER